MYRITVTLTPEAREDAIHARTMRGLPIPEQFLGPVFDDVAEFALEGGFIGLVLVGGTTYAYNSDTVTRLKIEALE